MIRREIEVTRKGLPRPIDVTYGTDWISLEFVITDFALPEGVESRAYAMGRSQKVKSQPCDVTGNKISFAPELGLFEEGKNVLQLAITYDEKELFTFDQPVNCHYTMKYEGAQKLENDPSMVAMVLQMNEELQKLSDDVENIEVPTKTSQLTNDSDFQTGSQVSAKIKEIIGDGLTLKFEKVNAVPETGEEGVIYLVPSESEIDNAYDEYIFIDGKSELIGTAKINLDGYVTTEEFDELLEQMNEYEFDHTAYGLPVLRLTGDTTGMSKDVKKTLSYVYGDKSGTCTLKWQGNSSIAYEKKNYTIVFDNPFEAKDGWGSQKKYCLKANFIDHSHARSIICARLWGQMVASRTGRDEKLNSLPNYGAIDGFPIVIELNGKFHGLYTFNVPKEDWLFGMGNGTKEAILCADVQSDAVGFKGLANLTSDFELEYSTNDETEWVLESLNNLIQMVMDSNGSNINKIGQYLDWNSAIDYYIHTVLIEGADNTKKNYILATYDGVKWFFSAYDMDSTFGLQWDGKKFLSIENRPTFATRGTITSDKLMYLIWTYKRQELRERYAQIRESVYSENNVYMLFTNFGVEIPKPILDKDVELYPSIPSSAVNNTYQILNYYRMRVALCDEWIKDTSGELDLPTQEVAYTNLVPLAIDTNGTIYNGTGYKDGYRLSSSGAEKTQSNSTLTGYIACTKNDIIELSGVVFGAYGNTGTDGITPGNGVGGLYSYLAIYDSNKTLLHCMQGEQSAISPKGISVEWGTYPIGLPTDITKFDFSGYTGGEMAYIRINAVGSGANLIVTKNEEIV